MPKTVLIAEDNRDVREMMTFMIHTHGYEVLEAEDGSQAVEKTKQYHPDLVLMDIMMPVMDGLEATRIIREFEEFEKVPIVAVTAYGKSCYQKAIEAGCTDVIDKPLDFEIIQPLLNKYLEQ
jgi:two-component system, cell cycle response regulator DivK